MRIERLAAAYDLRVVWIHFPLHPETPAEGRSLADLFAGRDFDLAAMKSRMKGLMEEQGLPYGDRSMTYNSRLAQELAEWAEGQQGGEAIHDALFRAYFVSGRNIGDVEVLMEVASGLGLNLAEAREVVENRSFSDAVDLDWRRSREMGVTGVPTFVIGGLGLVGAQPYAQLEELVVAAEAKHRD